MKYLRQSAKFLRNNIKKGQALILESTTYPRPITAIFASFEIILFFKNLNILNWIMIYLFLNSNF